MVEPFLELLVNAADAAATVIVLLALWDGRDARSSPIARWLGIRPAAQGGDVDAFLRAARGVAAQKAGREAPAEPPAGGRPPRLLGLS